jgi:hypothetical protein
MMVLLLGGCASSLGTPVVGGDGLLHCMDGDHETAARPVCTTTVEIEILPGGDGCSTDSSAFPADACADGASRFCAVLPSVVTSCDGWVAQCRALDATHCLVDFDPTNGNATGIRVVTE